eukprot:3935666-Rhodomonas_salina.3
MVVLHRFRVPEIARRKEQACCSPRAGGVWRLELVGTRGQYEVRAKGWGLGERGFERGLETKGPGTSGSGLECRGWDAFPEQSRTQHAREVV